MNKKMENEKKVEGEQKVEVPKLVDVNKGAEKEPTPKMRQIILETDGNDIRIVKAEVSGTIEMTGILQRLINAINSK